MAVILSPRWPCVHLSFGAAPGSFMVLVGVTGQGKGQERWCLSDALGIGLSLGLAAL